MPQYVFLLHESATFGEGLSASDIQAIIKKYKTWSQEMAAKGHLRGGQKLQDGTGRVMRSPGGKLEILDGPYSESKEVIGGFFIVEAANYAQAVELAKGCPHLEYGTMELREVEPT